MKDAILRYCKDRTIVERERLEDWVEGVCRSATGYAPMKGHVWACTVALVKSGHIDGMTSEDDRTLGVADVKLQVPKPKKQSKRMGFGWGEEE